MPLYFCSLPCWDAHLPEARHRDAWAEETQAPTRAAFEAELREQAAEQARKETQARNQTATRMEAERPRTDTRMDDKTNPRRIVSTGKDPDVPEEVLVVVSKLKAYVRARSGMNTSDSVVDALSDHLRRLCDRAIDNAAADGRKTVFDRDFKPLFKLVP